MANCEPEESPTLAEQGNDLLDLPDVVADASADGGAGDTARQVECALVPAIGAAAGTGDGYTALPPSQDQSTRGSGSV
jgi:hypothetical protein